VVAVVRAVFVGPRGVCTGCGEMRSIRKDDTIGRHSSLGAGDVCEGVGYPPMPATARPGGMPLGEGYQRRARCRVCDSPATLRKDGTVASHRWYKPGVGWMTGCGGNGKPPADGPPAAATPGQAAAVADLAVLADTVNRLGGHLATLRDHDGEVVTEYATGMSGGGMNVRPDDPEIERAYPLDVWIEHRQRDGGRVYQRRIVVIDDWEEVPRG
jgi:hypothetical protein